jgi:hypothetical protein
MLNAARRVSRLSDLPSLPVSVLSFDGQHVDTSQAIWRFRSSLDSGATITIHWTRLDELNILSARARHLVKLYFADRIARKKARTIENDFRMFLRLQEWLRSRTQPPAEWASLTEGLVRAFLQHGVERTADKGNDFSRLRTFFAGVLPDSIGISIRPFLRYCDRLRRLGTRRDTASASAMSSEGRFLPMNSC